MDLTLIFMLFYLCGPFTTIAIQPHIVFFLADDYGFADVAYHTKMYGNDSNVIATPNLDALSSSGVRLENYYIQPVCSPTRAALLTGRYAHHNGIHVALIDSSRSALPLNETTLAERLHSAGYATHAVGKWHLGFRSWSHTPEHRGFESFFGFYAGSQDYFNHESLCWAGAVPNGCFENTTVSGEPVTGYDLHRGNSTFNSSEYSTSLYASEAERIIRHHAANYRSGTAQMSKPLFLYLPHQAVHVGNLPEASHPEYARDQAPQRYIDKYDWVTNEVRRNLSAMVTVMDEAAGNVTNVLKEVGIWDDTIFIFSTDNGGPTYEMASNYPLKGGKATLWEGGVRGVGFVSGGNLAQFGVTALPRVTRGLMHITDWNPTLCDFAGGCPLPSKQPLDGLSARGLISRGEASMRHEIVHDICRKWMGGSCLKHLAKNPDAPEAQYASMVMNRGGIQYKIIVGQEKEGVYTPNLYDISSDPSEKIDIAGTNNGKVIVKEMLARLAEHEKTASMAHDRDPIDPRSDPRLHGGVWMPWE